MHGIQQFLYMMKLQKHIPFTSQQKMLSMKWLQTAFMFVLTAIVPAVFYFILGALGTANLIPSTFSVTTSFIAVYLTFRRDPYYAVAYAANDAVLIVLWALASMQNSSYISVMVCFAAFLANDIYGFINWAAMEKRQKSDI